MRRIMVDRSDQSVAQRSMKIIMYYYLTLRKLGVKKTISEISSETGFGEATIRNFLLILRDEKNDPEYKEFYRIAFKYTKFVCGELYEEQQNLLKEEKRKFKEAMEKLNNQKNSVKKI